MELSIVLYGRDTVDSANALTNLAYAQYRQERFETSRLNLQAAIKTIEEIGGNLSADLIRPLHRLGQTELALNETDSAIEKLPLTGAPVQPFGIVIFSVFNFRFTPISDH